MLNLNLSHHILSALHKKVVPLFDKRATVVYTIGIKGVDFMNSRSSKT